MPTIELLCGMISSGKSTYARKRADEGSLVVGHDDLSAMLHARYRYEHGLRCMYREMEEALARIGIKSGKDIVIDRTHLTRESRSRWTNWARDWCVPIVAVRFPISPAHVHATRRHEADPRGRTFLEWHGVALHHAEQAREEPLDPSEGFTEIRDAPPWVEGGVADAG